MCFQICEGDASFYARSQKMKLTTLSSAESEYVALCEAATEVIFLRQLLEDIGFSQENPTIVYEDNMACISMSNGLSSHKNSKHVNVKYHYTREQVINKRISVVYCKTSEMIADMLTKRLDLKQHQYCTRFMMNMALSEL
jgi:hypothetical protein